MGNVAKYVYYWLWPGATGMADVSPPQSLMMRPRFSPEVTLGHLIQAVTLVAMIGGGAITSYVSLRTDILAGQAANAKVVADVKEFLTGEQVAIKSRVLALEINSITARKYQDDMRRSIDQLINMVTDLRVQLGKRTEATERQVQ